MTTGSTRAGRPTGPSDRRVTSADVAREAGPSRATVSYVLTDDPRQRISDEARARVRDAAERLGYRPYGPARVLRGGLSRVALLVSPDVRPVGGMAAAIVDGVAAELEAAGIHLVWHL